MNDLERFTPLLDDFGIEYSYRISSNNDVEVQLISGTNKVGGYNGFFIIYSFTKDGNFNSVSIWE